MFMSTGLWCALLDSHSLLLLQVPSHREEENDVHLAGSDWRWWRWQATLHHSYWPALCFHRQRPRKGCECVFVKSLPFSFIAKIYSNDGLVLICTPPLWQHSSLTLWLGQSPSEKLLKIPKHNLKSLWPLFQFYCSICLEFAACQTAEPALSVWVQNRAQDFPV